MHTLEVIIGTVVFFLLLSLIATAVIEMLAVRMRQRGRVLRKAIDAVTDGGPEFVDTLYRHPLVYALYEEPKKGSGGADELALPSYIPNEVFAKAYVETALGLKIEEVEDITSFFASEKRLWVHRHERCESAARGVLSSKDLDDVYKALRPSALEAQGNSARMLELVGKQFERVNERARGWYRAWVGRHLFLVGLALAVFVNGDAFRVVGRITADPAVRAALVRVAESEIDAESGDRALLLDRLAAVDSLTSGWAQDRVLRPCVSVGYALAILSKVAGLVVTAFAVSLGAPFWFDLLNRLVSVRSSLAPKFNESGVERAKAAEGEALRSVSMAAGVDSGVGRGSTLSGGDFTLLHFLTQLSKASYGPATSVEAIAHAEGWRDAKVKCIARTAAVPLDVGGPAGGVQDPTTIPVDTQAYIVVSTRGTVIAFRGTEPRVIGDVLTDARFMPVPVAWFAGGDTEARVHRGFKAALDAVWGELMQEVEGALAASTGPLYFTGHSLGGALAVLAAARYLAGAETARRDRFGAVHTIGQPRVGNSAFARAAGTLLGPTYTRAVYHRDVVPRVPPPKLGAWEYAHFGSLHYFDTCGRLWLDPSVAVRLLDAVLPEEEVEQMFRDSYQHHAATRYVALYESAGRTS